MSIDTLIKTTFSDTFRKEIWQELSAGKLMSPDFKKNVKIGDEVNVQFHDLITLLDYTGEDLDIKDVQTADTTTVKVKINHGKAVFFKLPEQKIRMIENAKTNEEKIKLVREYTEDAREQFNREINKACCEEYVRAGHVIDNNGAAITVTKDNILDIFAKAKIELKKGDGKGHTAWSEGNMLAIVDTNIEAFLSTQKLLQYSDVMAKNYKKGYKGELLGFHIIVDDEICKDASGNVYPLFGRSGRTLAGGIQDDFKLESGKPVGGFNTHYWGKGVFGVKAPLAYLLCTAKLKADFTIGS
ncbi:TPA: hypothetical protein CPT89_01065 [Candidatus Gastranaerophilales bacterium HUM_11]|nr:MAG TPA: hypothetical protein CPT89_01065 [Candidatus Gastranaerophilales bacterium HUM_11]